MNAIFSIGDFVEKHGPFFRLSLALSVGENSSVSSMATIY